MDIEALHEALGAIQKDIAATEKRLSELGKHHQQLRIEKQGIESFLARHNGKPVRPSLKGENRTDAVVRVLAEADGPLQPRQIADLLAEAGRDNDPPRLVSAALAHLQKQARVRRTDHGWVALAPERDGRGELPLEGGGA